jgi:AraC-like DNA-binding protein
VESGHDRSSAPLARSSDDDLLSDVLRNIRLTGALFFQVDASSPWVEELPAASAFAGVLLPEAQHIVSYHVVTEGSCWGRLLPGRGTPVHLEAGDVMVIPHGHAYVMSSPSGLRASYSPDEGVAFLRAMARGKLPSTVTEGGGGPERLRVLCGFLGCDVRPFNPVLATLPSLLHVRGTTDGERGGLGALVQLAVAETRERRPGGHAVMLRLSELLFVEVVRHHLQNAPSRQRGWLAGLRDPLVGRALATLHGRPADPWTLGRLAREVGASRSTLAERFTRFAGAPPMQYLARWRMQLAARRLAEDTAKVSAIALEVGYESEAAFSRAFKRVVGASPDAWRRSRSLYPARASVPATAGPTAGSPKETPAARRKAYGGSPPAKTKT